MSLRYIAHLEDRWDDIDRRFSTYVTMVEFQTYQRMHKELSDSIIARQDDNMKEISRKLIRVEERQERIIDLLSSKNVNTNK